MAPLDEELHSATADVASTARDEEDTMFNHFAKNRGPVFMSGSVGGTGSAADAQNTLSTTPTGMDQQMTDLFNKGMAEHANMYAHAFDESIRKDQLQTQGDAALKTIKAVQIS